MRPRPRPCREAFLLLTAALATCPPGARSVAHVRARIYKLHRTGDGWRAFGIPVGRPRLRCTWEISEDEAELVRNQLGSRPVERDLGDPIRTVGVPERFDPTQGY